MSRSERLRKIIVESGSPIANHSLNQNRIKTEFDNEQSFYQRTSKKIQSADRKTAKRHQYETAKAERIANRVRAVFEGYDGFDPVILDHEIAFLRRNGVDVQAVLDTSSSDD